VTLSILKLAIGEAVQNANGTVGEVVSFTQNHVTVAWPDGTARYTDAELKAAGVVRFIPGIRRIDR
jgi:hypothetical protein